MDFWVYIEADKKYKVKINNANSPQTAEYLAKGKLMQKGIPLDKIKIEKVEEINLDMPDFMKDLFDDFGKRPK